ncbi:MAG: hypothetical protein ACTSVY_14845, partial [Candidatus Helarchaeota archaeon]
DLPNVFDINPNKALSGALSYLMPRLSSLIDIDSLMGGGSTSGDGLNEMMNNVVTMLKDSGLMDIIFSDTDKFKNFAMNLTIANTRFNLTLAGMKFLNIDLTLTQEINLSGVINGLLGESSSGGSGEESSLTGIPLSMPSVTVDGIPYMEISTFNGPFEITFEAVNSSETGAPLIPDKEFSYGVIQYWEDPENPANNSYYLNVTVYNATDKGVQVGWTYNSSTHTPIRYVVNEEGPKYSQAWNLTHTNSSGYITITGEIAQDGFGWVDPYLYIHAQQETYDTDPDWYWWNVTCRPDQPTLKGNKPIYAAKWVTPKSELGLNGTYLKDMVIQSYPPLPALVAELDPNYDDKYEIFARVEIDDNKMDFVHQIHYMERGVIDNLNMSHGNSYDVYLDDTAVNQNYTLEVVQPDKTATKYVFSEQVTPDGSNVVYPVNSKIITKFTCDSDNWVDDSLTKAVVYYYDINDTSFENPIYLLNWDIRNIGTWAGGSKRTDNTFGNLTIGQTLSNGTVQWLDLSKTSGVDKYDKLKFTYSYSVSNPNTQRMHSLDLGFFNFSSVSIEELRITYDVNDKPGSGTTTITAFDQRGYATIPSQSYRIMSDRGGNPYIYGYNLTGGTPNPDVDTRCPIQTGQENDKNAYGADYALLNFTYPIPQDKYISGVYWNITNFDGGSGGGGNNTAISGIRIQSYRARFYNVTDSQYYWIDLDPGLPIEPDQGATGQHIYENHTHPIGMHNSTWSYGNHAMYLSNRRQTIDEYWDYIQICLIVRDGDTGGRNIGYNDTTSGSDNRNPVDVYIDLRVNFSSYNFQDWGLDEVELPEGLISGVDVEMTMYDPQATNQTIPGSIHNDLSWVMINFSVSDMEQGSGLSWPTNLELLASKILIDLEAEDSIVLASKIEGDILFQDRNTSNGYLPVALGSQYQPYVTANISVLDIETQFIIDVNITQNQALRDYWLNLTNIDTAHLNYLQKITRLTVNCLENNEVTRQLTAFPKHPIKVGNETHPQTFQLGREIDLDPWFGPEAEYQITYYLTLRVSTDMLKAWDAAGRDNSVSIVLEASAVWSRPIGTYQVETQTYLYGIDSGPSNRHIYISH